MAKKTAKTTQATKTTPATPARKPAVPKRPWTAAEDTYIRTNILSLDEHGLAEGTGRTVREITARIKALEIDRDKLQAEARKDKAVEHLAIKGGTMSMTGARSAVDDARAPRGGGEEFLERYGDCIRRG